MREPCESRYVLDFIRFSHYLFKKLLIKINGLFINSKLTVSQVFQVLCIGRKVKNQTPGIKCLAMHMIISVDIFAPILSVSQQRPACVCHLNTNLMGSPSQETAFYQGKITPAL